MYSALSKRHQCPSCCLSTTCYVQAKEGIMRMFTPNYFSTSTTASREKCKLKRCRKGRVVVCNVESVIHHICMSMHLPLSNSCLHRGACTYGEPNLAHIRNLVLRTQSKHIRPITNIRPAYQAYHVYQASLRKKEDDFIANLNSNLCDT